MIETYRWVVIGYGAIANEMAQTLAEHGRMFYGVAGEIKSGQRHLRRNIKSKRYMGRLRRCLRMIR